MSLTTKPTVRCLGGMVGADAGCLSRGACIRCVEDPLTRTHLFVEVSFNAVRDAEQRQALNDIGTNFDLTDDDVDLLITASDQVLRQSPDFQTFLRRTNGQIKLP